MSGQININLTAIRVNHCIDLTTLPELCGKGWPYEASGSAPVPSWIQPTNPLACLEHRDQAIVNHNGKSFKFFSLYRAKKWTSATQPTRSILRMEMPAHVRQVCAVQLLGYSIHHKQAVGTQQQHEYKEDDWFALRFKELPGSVLSNNMHANGSFHVIHAGKASDKESERGSIQYYDYEPNGLVESKFAPRGLPTLTVELVDREGKEAHFGRMHIWLRVCVTKCT